MEESSELPAMIGPYNVLKKLGRGGMGEVFLVQDPFCKRQVALKKIKNELKENPLIRERFLREAKIAAQLTHPCIMPIYTIHADDDLFYTMPYVEGETLRQIIRTCIAEEKSGELQHPIGSSIPALIRIFFSICGAISYCHAKGILHRDLKLENIIIGKYGEVLILDWGLAHPIGEEPHLPQDCEGAPAHLTKPGKIAGTLSYLAPERLLGTPPTLQTDIYALGIILYQLLSFKTPFYRPTIQIFRKLVHKEKFRDPHEIAPFRNIPPYLVGITKRCLHPNPASRYKTVEELLVDLNSYIEGRPEWMSAAALRIDVKEDWEFQENILLSKRMALTGALDTIEWVSLMLSKEPFAANIKIEATLSLKETGSGIGFLLGVPDQKERKSFDEGYCLWIGSSKKPICKLFRSNIEVMDIPATALSPGTTQKLCIETTANHLRFYLDGKQVCHYMSHLPLNGGHVGLLYRDGDFELGPLQISIGSQNVTVSCLAIPDAFLACGLYAKALLEYRKISTAFKGRQEAEAAIFRAGITLLEEAKLKTHRQKKQIAAKAFDEFTLLRNTPGAPLEYLGKALVYESLTDIEEEMKCLELPLRKYAKHPQLRSVIEHIVFRLHETASKDRIAAFHYALLTLRFLPHTFASHEGLHLLEALKKGLEPSPFFETTPTHRSLAIQLAWYLGKPAVLMELLETELLPEEITNTSLALLCLGYKKWLKNHDDLTEKGLHYKNLKLIYKIEESLFTDFSKIQTLNKKALYYLLDRALKTGHIQHITPLLERLDPQNPLDQHFLLKAHLLLHNWSTATKLIDSLPSYITTRPDNPFFLLIGAFIWHTEGKKAMLTHLLQGRSVPSHGIALLKTYFQDRETFPSGWDSKILHHEKISLFHYLQILYESGNEKNKAVACIRRMKKELERVQKNNTYA